jgi:beta-1,4-mannooligosaccharide/beta-1,4-mannosyl-N-acetylglucosamine phosphorylase
MSVKIEVHGTGIANIPWADPGRGELPVWRYSGNPVIARDIIPTANSVFNSAVTPFKDGFAGVFRCDDICRRMNIHRGFSADGIHWTLDEEPIEFTDTRPGLPESEYKYDPRVIRIGERFYIIWCNGYHGPSIGAGYTDDFETFHRMENFLMPYNRNGVLFPEKIDGRFALLHRPSDSGHTTFGDIFYSESPDLTYWGRHRHVMSPCGSESAWQSTKVGAGPAPIRTQAGWLLFYHGVLTSCNGFVYSMGAALLDLKEPWRVLYRTRPYLLNPRETYEQVGDVQNVVFPCGALCDADTGRIAIYYGCADTCTGLAFTTVDRIVPYIRNNSL